MSDSRTSSGHRSPLIAVQWLHRKSEQSMRRPRTPPARISSKVIFFWRVRAGIAPSKRVTSRLATRCCPNSLHEPWHGSCRLIPAGGFQGPAVRSAAERSYSARAALCFDGVKSGGRGRLHLTSGCIRTRRVSSLDSAPPYWPHGIAALLSPAFETRILSARANRVDCVSQENADAEKDT
jgi:hypothetical protein